MVDLNLSVLLEDNRFEEAKLPKKKKLPHQLHWFVEQDYFSNELLGVRSTEIESYKSIAEDAYLLFVEATKLVIAEGSLGDYVSTLSIKHYLNILGVRGMSIRIFMADLI